MESALVAIVCVALMLFGMLALVQSTLFSIDTVSSSWKQMEIRSGEISRTEIAIDAAVTLELGNTIVRITVANQGQVSFHDFSKWDVLVQYYDAGDSYHILRASYTSSDPPGNNEWTNLAPTPTVFGPGILNPGEQMEVKLKLSPAIKAGSDFLVVVATTNGVTGSRSFTA